MLPQDCKLEFLGDSFDKIVESLTTIKEEKILNWIVDVVQENIRPILIGSTKEYKEWKINQLLTFRYQFSIDNTEYRILLVKVKNSVYIEFHIGNHKYYDKVRKDLSLKEPEADYQSKSF